MEFKNVRTLFIKLFWWNFSIWGHKKGGSVPARKSWNRENGWPPAKIRHRRFRIYTYFRPIEKKFQVTIYYKHFLWNFSPNRFHMVWNAYNKEIGIARFLPMAIGFHIFLLIKNPFLTSNTKFHKNRLNKKRNNLWRKMADSMSFFTSNPPNRLKWA